MNLFDMLRSLFRRRDGDPLHLVRGRIGENAARKHLVGLGYKFLIANYRDGRGEIDLILRDGDCLVFVEVKARSSEDWGRPASAVRADKRRLLSKTALAYLRHAGLPKVNFRFDIVEVLLEGNAVDEIRHLPNSFPLEGPYRYL